MASEWFREGQTLQYGVRIRCADNNTLQQNIGTCKPDYVHVLIKGKIVKSGGPELALELEEKGYEWLESAAKEDD